MQIETKSAKNLGFNITWYKRKIVKKNWFRIVTEYCNLHAVILIKCTPNISMLSTNSIDLSIKLIMSCCDLMNRIMFTGKIIFIRSTKLQLFTCYMQPVSTRTVILGYEPAGLTMHPPPNDRGWVHFYRIGF